MTPLQITLLAILGIDSFMHLIGEYLIIKRKSGYIFRYLTKPLLMPLLAAFYAVSTISISWWMIAGMIGGFLGDIFLMLPDPSGKKITLKIGLIAFLFGHISYIVAFVLLGWNYSGFLWWSLIIGGTFVIYGAIIATLLLKHTGKMSIPVAVYIVVIIMMGVSTSVLIGIKTLLGVILLIIGAWFFVISDTFNAFNKFAKPIPNERLITMSTYILGQFMIVLGYLYAG